MDGQLILTYQFKETRFTVARAESQLVNCTVMKKNEQ